jgi:hypothetical protein
VDESGWSVMSAEVMPRFAPLLSSNKALMAAWSMPVGKALSVIVQTKTSGVVLPTALNELWDRASLQKKGVPCPSHPLELRPPAMTADQSDVPPGAPVRVALLQPLMLADTTIKNPELVSSTKVDGIDG